jgi:allantoicase
VTLQAVDLAARRLGGTVLAANDEYFAPKENLLAEHPPAFDPRAYTDRGKLMDGWETRRRRTPGHDWCVVRLGVPGIVQHVVVDTTHFKGNYPEACALEGCVAEESAAAIADDVDWFPLLGRTPLQGDTVHRFLVQVDWRVTHVRLSIFPDGGVARLRVRGDPLPDLRRQVGTDGRVDLAATRSGGIAVDCSDRFFSSPHNLLAPGAPRNMGDGWETRRRRGPGHDWAVIALAATGVVDEVVIDTTHFKGNYPDRCGVEGRVGQEPWRMLVDETPVGPDASHTFRIDDPGAVAEIRLNVYPDGGVARLRVYGRVTDDGWRAWGTRWIDALSPNTAAQTLRACCGSSAWVAAMAARRPFGDFAALTRQADEVWNGLTPDDWLEAFANHPRIGDRTGGRPEARSAGGGRGDGGGRPEARSAGGGRVNENAENARWSRQEQAGTASADRDTLQALEEGNGAYEERFGHVFLICASGRSAEEMLAALRERLGNDPATELRIAAEEQRKITRIRLDKVVRPAHGS